jgi:23S rRNA U2552 (ribose-2'-O)-methylase RlmE/FtsJ
MFRVLHDGSPKVGTSWTHDAYSQSELVLMAAKLATEFLRSGGLSNDKINIFACVFFLLLMCVVQFCL